jgi:hypothetical protein
MPTKSFVKLIDVLAYFLHSVGWDDDMTFETAARNGPTAHSPGDR